MRLLLVLAGVSLGAGLATMPPAMAAESPATFDVPSPALHEPFRIVAYGDMRFTDPTNHRVTDPVVRDLLVRTVARRKPTALLLGGDLPFKGTEADYAVYRRETSIWTQDHLRIFPVLGNHEFKGCDVSQCLARWWTTFPKLRGHRWYSVQFGDYVYGIALDSNTSLLTGSPQRRWLAQQISALPESVRYLLIWLHHPLLTDKPDGVRDGPRPNEIALRHYLEALAPTMMPRLLVISSHVHNYERFRQAGIDFVVTGGGGAHPDDVMRTPADLFQSAQQPNYNYVELTITPKKLHVSMHRLAFPLDHGMHWITADQFDITPRRDAVPLRSMRLGRQDH